jgi:hypothetical protein
MMKEAGVALERNRNTCLKMILLMALAGPTSTSLMAASPGFKPMFDGKTLNGWKGDASVWSVRDGTITGSSGNEPLKSNTFLIFQQPYGNFELHYKYRWQSPEGNSGFQFRSGIVEGNYVMTGYQANVVPISAPPERYGMLYNELGDRQELMLLGQKGVITRRSANGMGTGRIVRTVTGMVNSREDIMATIKPEPEWNEVVLIAYGRHMVEAINGMLAFDAVDNDPVGPDSGFFGLQAHGGPPMTVQFKDIEIKVLTSEPKTEGRFKSKPSPAPAPTQTYKDSNRAGLPDVALPTN